MKKKVVFMFLLIINCINIFSCNMINSGITLTGKIAIEGIRSDSCTVYLDSNRPWTTFKLKNDKEVHYSGVLWLYSEDSFLASEIIPGSNRDEYKINIAKIDLSGKLVYRIYESKKGELAWVSYPSRDDKYLLFTTHKRADPKIYPFEGLTPMLSLHIMDLKQKEVIRTFDSIGRSPNFTLNESPWLQDGYRFVYSISEGPKINSEGKRVNPVEKDSAGIYIYNVDTGERRMLILGGNFAIASPVKNQIAYLAEKSIEVLDLNSNEKKTVYKVGADKEVNDLHWTPDGKYIYLAYAVNRNGVADLLNSTGEKLIEVSTGKEIRFNKIGQAFNHYTWK